jgi:hypothetical protein
MADYFEPATQTFLGGGGHCEAQTFDRAFGRASLGRDSHCATGLGVARA